MDAPTYPPAAHFEAPAPAPCELSIAWVSLADLMRAPAAWAVVLKHAPMLKLAIGAPQLKPQLGNFTVDSFITYGVVDQKTVEAIDAELRGLPQSAWPAL